ncbi:Conserved_hypothetical protein [Hexamita inflata]|uniref:Uncharacterized protein n=1 Tax=Hexamita inflata TaxID=28002 RepID=A0AA86RPE8_9EUKA|nr:Conserved hypothetical protein [Hexamita inflata]
MDEHGQLQFRLHLNVDDLDLENLEVLNLYRNSLENDQLYNLTKFKKLHTLDVSFNKVDLTHIHSATSLTTLAMPGCGLYDIDQITYLINLEVLNVADNQLLTTNSIGSLLNLKELDISYNDNIDIAPLKDLVGLTIQLWEVELLFLVYYVSNYILKYFATSNADDKFQQIISSWRLFMNYSLTQEGQKYDFDRIRPQSTIQSRYLIFQKGKIEITTCNKRTAMTKINAVEDVQGRSTNSLNKLRQF